MDVKHFVARLRALPPEQAVELARETIRTPGEREVILPHPHFRAWVMEMAKAGHLDHKDTGQDN